MKILDLRWGGGGYLALLAKHDTTNPCRKIMHVKKVISRVGAKSEMAVNK